MRAHTTAALTRAPRAGAVDPIDRHAQPGLLLHCTLALVRALARRASRERYQGARRICAHSSYRHDDVLEARDGAQRQRSEVRPSANAPVRATSRDSASMTARRLTHPWREWYVGG